MRKIIFWQAMSNKCSQRRLVGRQVRSFLLKLHLKSTKFFRMEGAKQRLPQDTSLKQEKATQFSMLCEAKLSSDKIQMVDPLHFIP